MGFRTISLHVWKTTAYCVCRPTTTRASLPKSGARIIDAWRSGTGIKPSFTFPYSHCQASRRRLSVVKCTPIPSVHKQDKFLLSLRSKLFYVRGSLLIDLLRVIYRVAVCSNDNDNRFGSHAVNLIYRASNLIIKIDNVHKSFICVTILLHYPLQYSCRKPQPSPYASHARCKPFESDVSCLQLGPSHGKD